MSDASVVTIPLTLGRQIAEARTRVGMNQTALAARWGVSLSTISRWERDQGEPEFRQIVDLAKLSGWPLATFAAAVETPEFEPEPSGPNITVITGESSFA